jgi:hypothetical protein
MAVVAPPLDLTIRFLKLYRSYRSSEIEIVYPNGDSYILNLEETRIFFKGMRIKDRIAEKALDLLWNSYALQFDLQRQEYITIANKSEVYINDDPDENAWIL